MKARDLTKSFYVIAAMPWLFAGYGDEPAFFVGLSLISMMSLLGPVLIRLVRRNMERGIVPGPDSWLIKDRATKEVHRLIAAELSRAVYGGETAARHLRRLLDLPADGNLDPEMQRQLEESLVVSTKNLIEARAILGRLTAAGKPAAE
jgi:hypothetical protein